CVEDASLAPLDGRLGSVRSIILTPTELAEDRDGDGHGDNAFLSLVAASYSLIAGGGNVIEDLQQTLEDGRGELLLELSDASGDAWLAAYRATSDIDGDGAPDEAFAVRVGDDGVFAAFDDQFDLGPIHAARARIDGTSLTTDPMSFPLYIPRDGGFALSGFYGELVIEHARITAELDREEPGLTSVDSVAQTEDGPIPSPGLLVRGVVPLTTVARIFSEALASCTCASLRPTPLVETWVEAEYRAVTECEQDVSGAPDCGVGDPIACENLETICGAMGLMGGIADVDTDGDGLRDALSFEARLSVAPAVAADPPLVGR
ncbi:MAG: hypothetical protein KDA28_02355, partial [Phycisphaerales bacterium]|nr:hypothetical protein [Phycisphaerales bacterium]